MLKFLFVCKKRSDFYGSFGLYNSAQFVSNYLNEKQIPSKVVEVIDNNHIEKEIVLYKPDIVIIEALWVVPEKVLLLSNLYPKIKWIVRIHSQIPFLANEGIAVKWIKELLSFNKHNIKIAFNHSDAVNDFNTTFHTNKFLYLPNLYKHKSEYTEEKNTNKEVVHIGCFGAIRPLKNQLMQAFAAINFADFIGKKLCFHINASRTEQKGEQALKNIQELFKGTRHELIEHSWFPHKDFLQLVSSMDMGLQVSLSETFNIVAADFVHCKVPIVVSDEIFWMPFWTKSKATKRFSIFIKLLINYYLSKLKINRTDGLFLSCYNHFSFKYWKSFVH